MIASASAIRSYFEDGVILRFFRACRDEEIDNAYEVWALTNLKQLALHSLNVDESDLTRPIDYVWGTLGKNSVVLETKNNKGKTIKTWPYFERRGKDKIWRGSTRLFANIMYGRDQLMVCTTFYSVTGGVWTRPNSYEYFYQDIVSAETNQHSFILTSSGGTRVEVPLEAMKDRNQTGDRERAEGAVRNVRAMLRDKKGSKR